jgi:hypothetical protein
MDHEASRFAPGAVGSQRPSSPQTRAQDLYDDIDTRISTYANTGVFSSQTGPRGSIVAVKKFKTPRTMVEGVITIKLPTQFTVPLQAFQVRVTCGRSDRLRRLINQGHMSPGSTKSRLNIDPTNFVVRSVWYDRELHVVTALQEGSYLELLQRGSIGRLQYASNGELTLERVASTISHHDHVAPYVVRAVGTGGTYVEIVCGKKTAVW